MCASRWACVCLRRSASVVAILGLLLVVTAGLLLLTAGDSPVQAQATKVGLVFENPAGGGDLSFNQMAYQALLRAGAELGVVGTTYTPHHRGGLWAAAAAVRGRW